MAQLLSNFGADLTGLRQGASCAAREKTPSFLQPIRVCRHALVLGAADVGKSTFCRFLLGHLRARGRRTALLDTDVGQKTVGPPACVTLAGADRSALFFVGTTD